MNECVQWNIAASQLCLKLLMKHRTAKLLSICGAEWLLLNCPFNLFNILLVNEGPEGHVECHKLDVAPQRFAIVDIRVKK